MGTSSSGSGAGGANPLIPSWISPTGAPQNQNSDNDDNDNNETNDDVDNESSAKVNDNVSEETESQANSAGQNTELKPEPKTNRYRQPKSDFNKFVRSGGQDRQAFSNALKGYSRNASGSTKALARRMSPSASRVGSFFEAINAIKNDGLSVTLKVFNLSSYENEPLLNTLSALSDVIFSDNEEAYENTQDDSITKLAYANTVTRICEETTLDLNTLTNEQIETMTAIFIEETIVQRVIVDLGNKMPAMVSDIDTLLEIENNAFQIVNGLVRNRIMPEIIATQRGTNKNINQQIENIYRIAFDALGGIRNN